MRPVDRTRPELPEHGAVITIGGVRVRIRRVWGMERSPTPIAWDVLDGERVAASFMSRPSADDCQRALRAHQLAEPQQREASDRLAAARLRGAFKGGRSRGRQRTQETEDA